jgi:hypothetical protein
MERRVGTMIKSYNTYIREEYELKDTYILYLRDLAKECNNDIEKFVEKLKKIVVGKRIILKRKPYITHIRLSVVNDVTFKKLFELFFVDFHINGKYYRLAFSSIYDISIQVETPKRKITEEDPYGEEDWYD